MASIGSTPLKRTWSGSNSGNQRSSGHQNDNDSTSRSGIPALPKISGEILVQVLTHKSLRRLADDDSPQDLDNERLAELGMKILDGAVTAILFNRSPPLNGTEMMEASEKILTDENITSWAEMYRLHSKLRCHPDAVQFLKSPEEAKTLFTAYVGGVYLEGGLEPVQTWLDGLINDKHTFSASSSIARPPPYISNASSQLPPQKKVKPDTSSIFFAAQPLPSSTPTMMPQIAPVYPSSYGQPQYHTVALAPKKFANPLAPAQPNLAFLPIFNQTATQRRVNVEYRADFSGPSHAGKWSIQCVVNGIVKGVGAGGSKQVAKEEAAKQAWYNLGWS